MILYSLPSPLEYNLLLEWKGEGQQEEGSFEKSLRSRIIDLLRAACFREEYRGTVDSVSQSGHTFL